MTARQQKAQELEQMALRVGEIYVFNDVKVENKLARAEQLIYEAAALLKKEPTL